MTDRVALLGGGKMGEALLAGLVRANGPSSVVVAERFADRAAELHERYGVATATSAEAAIGADTVVLAVKPADVSTVLADIRAVLRPDTLVVSVAAGVTTQFLADHLPDRQPVVRVMPNTPAFVGQGMSVLSPGASATAAHLDRAEGVLSSVGRVMRVDESAQDAVTAVSGSGPAYFFYVVEAMRDAGVSLGLDREVALELAIQTALGAGTMMRESTDDPAVLRGNVTSPNGTTARAIETFDERGLRDVVLAAMQAARDRSAELGGELS